MNRNIVQTSVCVCVSASLFFYWCLICCCKSLAMCCHTFTHQLPLCSKQDDWKTDTDIDRQTHMRRDQMKTMLPTKQQSHTPNPKSIERFQRVNVSKVSHFNIDYVKTLKCAHTRTRLKVALDCAFIVIVMCSLHFRCFIVFCTDVKHINKHILYLFWTKAERVIMRLGGNWKKR